MKKTLSIVLALVLAALSAAGLLDRSGARGAVAHLVGPSLRA